MRSKRQAKRLQREKQLRWDRLSDEERKRRNTTKETERLHKRLVKYGYAGGHTMDGRKEYWSNQLGDFTKTWLSNDSYIIIREPKNP